MASTSDSPTNSDWIELPPSSDQVYSSDLQASSTYSGGAEAENQEHNRSSWGWWDLVQKPLSWVTVTTGDTSSVDQKDVASNMAVSAPLDKKKGASGLIKKAGGAVKKIFTGTDEQFEVLDYKKEIKVNLNV